MERVKIRNIGTNPAFHTAIMLHEARLEKATAALGTSTLRVIGASIRNNVIPVTWRMKKDTPVGR